MLFTGLARGMSNDLQRRASNVRAELIFMRPGAIQATGASLNLDVRYVDRLKAIDGVEDAIAVGRYFFQGTNGIGIEQIDGVDWEAYARMNGNRLVAGQAPSGTGEAIIDEVKARNNNYHVGDSIKPFGNVEYRIAGIYAPESGPRVKVTLAALQQALEAPGKCTFVFVKLRNPDQLDAMAMKINQELPEIPFNQPRCVCRFRKDDSLPWGFFVFLSDLRLW